MRWDVWIVYHLPNFEPGHFSALGLVVFARTYPWNPPRPVVVVVVVVVVVILVLLLPDVSPPFDQPGLSKDW